MKLSYVISTLNRRKQLDFSLFTLANQTLDDYEVVLVDDNSTEDIESLYRQYKSKMKMQYIRLEHESGWRDCSIGLNHGIRASKGEVIAVSMPEVALSKRGLELLYEPHYHLTKYPHHYSYQTTDRKIAILQSPIWLGQVPMSKKKWSELSWTDYIGTLGALDEIDRSVQIGNGWGNFVCISLKRKDWEELGGLYEFESWGSTDPNFQHRRRSIGCSEVLIDLPEAVILHQWHESSEKRNRGNDQLESRSPEEIHLPFLSGVQRKEEIVRHL